LSTQIISIKEARKLLDGKSRGQLTDAQIVELINQLDFIATLSIKDYKSKLKNK
jgi:hypothetical protein